MNHSVPLCHVDDLPDRSSRGFDPARTGRDTLFVVRTGATLHGWIDRCPHEGDTPLPYRRHAYLNKAATRIVCFAHGAQFDIGSGRCVAGPCVGQSLARVPLTVCADGQVLAEVHQRGAA
jgi:nitrite reductase/ring-hydroxylating ferredoxin subunit